MSEKVLSASNYDSRDEVARLKEQLAKAEATVVKEEVWGAHDVAVANDGEASIGDYMDNRPADGIVRDGESFRETVSGKFSSEASYENGIESEAEYYNRLEGGNESNANYQAPDYVAMNVQELVQAMGAAEKINDTATSNEAAEALQMKIDAQAIKEQWTQAQKDEQMDAVMDSVLKLSARPETTNSEVTPADSAAESAETIDTSSPAAEDESMDDYEARQQLRINDGDIVIDQVDNMPDDSEAESPQEDAEAVADDAEAEDQALGNRVKTAFSRAKRALDGGLIKLYYGLGSSLNKLRSNERKENESDTEYQERMKRNGRRLAIGITAVAVAYGAYKLHQGLDSGSGNGGTLNSNAMSGHLDTVTSTPDATGSWPEGGTSFSHEVFTVDRGEGWYQTFNDMNIPTSEHADLLQKVGPQLADKGYAYLDGGEYRISAPGQLPQDVLELIKNNR